MSRKRLRSNEEGGCEEPSNKRARELIWKVPEEVDTQLNLCSVLFNDLKKYKDSDHGNLCDLFMRAPTRRLYPGYYEVVEKPMDFTKIQQKLKSGDYRSVSSFLADIQLILDNTRQFFPLSSLEHQQAAALERACSVIVKDYGLDNENESDSDSLQSPTELTLRIPTSRLPSISSQISSHLPVTAATMTPVTTAVPSSSSSTSSTVSAVSKSSEPKVPSLKINLSSIRGEGKSTASKGGGGASSSSKFTRSQMWIQEYLSSGDPVKMYTAAVFSYRDSTGDFIAEPFHHLPSRTQYPEYYKVITQPIDLNMIRSNTEAGKYPNLRAIQDDMIIMIKNAHHFNEPGSDIYKKASQLRKFLIKCCMELERRYHTTASTMAADTVQKHSPEPEETTAEGGEGKKTPKLKISLKEKESVKRSSVSSMSDLEEAVVDSSDDENFSEEEGGEEPCDQDAGTTVKRKLVLHIKKEKVTQQQQQQQPPESPLTKLLKSKRPPVIKKKLLAVYHTMIDKTDEEGRVLSELFMRRPSAKLYPEYYVVIKEPIDLREILGRIRGGAISSLEELGKAVELMVNNAITFNEEGSQIYSDALVLKEVAETAIAKIQQAWSGTPTKSTAPAQSSGTSVGRGRPKKVAPHVPKTNDVVGLFQTVKEYFNIRGKLLWSTFKEIPSGISSDYYTVVKKPIDMTVIQGKVDGGSYQNVDQLMEDFTLMTDNAISFYPAESEQAQHALALQRVIMKRYTHLKSMAQIISEDVKEKVQKILSQLMATVFEVQGTENTLRNVVVTRKVKVQDEEAVKDGDTGRTEVSDEWEEHSFKMDHVKTWVAAGEYQRLDTLQNDVCALLCRASQMGRGLDVINLASKFMATRDELCGESKGQLWSPALQYTFNDLLKDLEDASPAGRSKSISPTSPAVSESDSQLISPTGVEGVVGVEWQVPGGKCEECDVCEWRGEKYQVGDIVYVAKSGVTPGKPHIVLVEKFWTDTNNSMCFDGQWFYRPEETFHVATAKFYENEVFRSDFHGVGRVSQVVGRACVLPFKTYIKQFPKGFPAEDVFVCKERYCCKTKTFKKIKQWSWPGTPPTLMLREKPLHMIRVPSVFARAKSSSVAMEQEEVTEKEEEEKEEGEEEGEVAMDVSYIEPTLENVSLDVSSNPRSKYYEQFCIDEDCFRTGDFVYLRSDQELPFIARIDRMWTDSNGDPWIHGPWFLRPNEVEHAPTRTFYKQELLLSNIQDTNPMRSISGRCLVMGFTDYCNKRPTGYAEADVYVCLAKYNEVDKEIKRLKGWRTFQHSRATRKDEIYYFTEEMQPTKVASPKLFSKEYSPKETMPQTEATPTSVAGTAVPQVVVAAEPVLALGGGAPGSKQKGLSIPPQFIQQLLASASKLNTSSAAQTATPTLPASQSSTPSSVVTPTTTQLAQALMSSGMAAKILASTQLSASSSPLAKQQLLLTTPPQRQQPQREQQQQQQQQQLPQVFPCYWEDCSKTFPGPLDLYHHVVGPGPSHLSSEVEGAYYCRWRNCPRNPKSTTGRSFDSMNKIVRHMKEVHLMKISSLFGIGVRAGGIPRVVPPVSSVPVTPVLPPSNPLRVTPKVTPSLVRATVPPGPAVVTTPISVEATPTPPPAETTPPPPPEPVQPKPTTSVTDIFTPPPANKQNLVHSSIYLRYIQGLKCNSHHLSSTASNSSVIRSSNQTANVPPPKAEDWFSSDALKAVTERGGAPLSQKEKEKAVTDALWALRDLMNRDSLRLAGYLDRYS